MAYDNEAIKNVKKQQVFDDSFDPLALSISKQEKKSMVRGLNAAKQDIEQSIPSAQVGKSARTAQAGKGRAKKRGFWRTLGRFVLRLFGGARGEDYIIKKRLKALRRQLRRFKPAVFNFKHKAVSAHLAKQVYVVFEYLMPYRSSFAAIFKKKKDDKAKLDFQLQFLKACSSNIHVDKISVFNEEQLAKAVAMYPEDQLKERLKALLKKYLSTYSLEERKKINRTYSEMLHINALFDFDFIGFFDRFHKDFTTHKHGKPSFNDAQPLGLVPFLKKLPAILLRIDLNAVPNVFDAVRYYYQHVILPQDPSNEKALFTSIMDRMSKSGYRPLTIAIQKILEGEKMSLLVRYISQEFNFQPMYKSRSEDFFRAFAQGLVDDVNKRVRRLYKDKARQSLNKKLLALLNVGELPSAYVYGEGRNEILNKFSLPIFAYPKLLNFMALFFENVYAGETRVFLNKVVAEGHFVSNDTMRSLSEAIHEVDECRAELADFCMLVSPVSDKGKMLDMMINKFNSSSASKSALTMHINSLNKNVAARVVHFKECVHSLRALLANAEVRDSLYRQGASKDPKIEQQFQEIEDKMVQGLAILHKLETG